MLPTKVEIKLKKTESGSWSRLDVPKEAKLKNSESNENVNLNSQIESVDLSDL